MPLSFEESELKKSYPLLLILSSLCTGVVGYKTAQIKQPESTPLNPQLPPDHLNTKAPIHACIQSAVKASSKPSVLLSHNATPSEKSELKTDAITTTETKIIALQEQLTDLKLSLLHDALFALENLDIDSLNSARSLIQLTEKILQAEDEIPLEQTEQAVDKAIYALQYRQDFPTIDKIHILNNLSEQLQSSHFPALINIAKNSFDADFQTAVAQVLLNQSTSKNPSLANELAQLSLLPIHIVERINELAQYD